MEKVDLYKALEVSKEASQDEIRRSYRKLARKYHPAANPGDRAAEERFKEIQQAYEILSKPEKRREYDEGPRTFFGSQGAGQPGGADFGDISDLLGGFGNLGDIFGRASGTTQRTRVKGDNITVNVRLSFKDALNGVTTRVGVPVEEGRGDDFVVEVPVSFVEAALGAQIEVPRPGGGTVKVRLPAGTQDGKQFKVRGAGAPRAKKNGAEKGNLIVRVRVVVPKKLKRREREILEALAEERDEDVRQDLFKKVGS